MAERKQTSPKGSAPASSPRVVVLLGSASDLPVIEKMLPLLDRFGLPYLVEIASAHRQPEKLKRIVKKTEKDGAEIFVAVAGMAAHLPGVVASLTARPVIGVPVASGPLAGVDALLSIVQMPPGGQRSNDMIAILNDVLFGETVGCQFQVAGQHAQSFADR